MKQTIKKLVIKIGTNVITDENGCLSVETILKIVKQVCLLKKSGRQIIVITSGAVAAGRSKLSDCRGSDDVACRQVWSAVGQAELMAVYNQLFGEQKCAQVLSTKEDFRDARHRSNMINCLRALLENDVVPVINENDAVAIDELMFTDNDELAGLLAEMLRVDALIFLTNVDGVLVGNSDKTKARVLNRINGATNWKKWITPKKSSFGKGGMFNKCRIGQIVAERGIAAHIVNGKRDNVLIDLVLNRQFIGTLFN